MKSTSMLQESCKRILWRQQWQEMIILRILMKSRWEKAFWYSLISVDELESWLLVPVIKLKGFITEMCIISLSGNKETKREASRNASLILNESRSAFSKRMQRQMDWNEKPNNFLCLSSSSVLEVSWRSLHSSLQILRLLRRHLQLFCDSK